MKKNKDMSFVSKEMKRKNYMNDDTKKIISFIVVLLIVGLAFGGLFLLQNKVVSKKTNQEETTAVTYQEQKIIVPEIFTKKDKEFKVLLIDTKNDLEMVHYNAAMNSYSKSPKLYIVDLDDGMNAYALNPDKEANTKPTKSSEVSVKSTTLMIVKDGKVTSFITDQDKILSELK